MKEATAKAQGRAGSKPSQLLWGDRMLKWGLMRQDNMLACSSSHSNIPYDQLTEATEMCTLKFPMLKVLDQRAREILDLPWTNSPFTPTCRCVLLGWKARNEKDLRGLIYKDLGPTHEKSDLMTWSLPKGYLGFGGEDFSIEIWGEGPKHVVQSVSEPGAMKRMSVVGRSL